MAAEQTIEKPRRGRKKKNATNGAGPSTPSPQVMVKLPIDIKSALEMASTNQMRSMNQQAGYYIYQGLVKDGVISE